MEKEQPQGQQRYEGLRHFGKASGFFLLACCAGTTLLAWLGSLWWFFDILSNFRAQYFWLSLILLLGFAAFRKWRFAIGAALLLVLNLALILPLYWGNSGTLDRERSQLSLLVFNVNYNNSQSAKVAEYVASQNVDVVVIIEATTDMESTLSETLPGYEKFGYSRTDAFGMLLYSRVPIVNSQEHYFAGSELLTIAAKVRKEGEEFSILGLHTMPPVGAANSELRDTMLSEAKKWANAAAHPIIVGDFNATPWSHAFGDLIDGDLHNSQRGFGLQTSWPSGMWPLSIPIDHVVMGKSLMTIERSVGPFLGSDHRPIHVTIGFAQF